MALWRRSREPGATWLGQGGPNGLDWSGTAADRARTIERLTKAILVHRETRQWKKHGVRTYDAALYKALDS